MTDLTRSKGTDSIYGQVPSAQRERLFGFRATHLYRQLAIDGVSWRYLACGQGRKALLFLPGAFLKADMWFNQILTLEQDYRMIAPDAYALQHLFDLDAVCEALVQSLDAEGIDRATVIGLSAGGAVAQVLLQAYPERVEHVVFSHCGVLEHNVEVDVKTNRILWLVRLLPMVVTGRVLKWMTTGKIPSSSGWIAFHEAYMQEAIHNIDRAMITRFLRSGLEARRRFTFEFQVLESWPGSILLLSSEDDALSRTSLDKLRMRYPRAETALLQEGGHHSFLFFPEAYTSALRGFLDETSRRGARWEKDGI